MTNPTGNPESYTEKVWLDLETQVQNYVDSLVKVKKSTEIDNILNITHLELNAISAETCGEYAFLLSQYSTYLQREYNRHSAKNKWANDNLDLCAAQYENNNTYLKWEQRRMLCVNENSYAKALFKYIRYTNVVLKELDFLALKIEKQAEMLNSLQMTKRKQC